MSRQRKVFPTSKIAGLFAAQSVPEARNQQGNFYFNGKRCYSYGSHFVIAKLLDNKVALLSNRGYSSTTNRQVWDVRSALNRWNWRIVNCHDADGSVEENAEIYRSEAVAILGKIASAVTKAEAYVQDLLSTMDDAKTFGEMHMASGEEMARTVNPTALNIVELLQELPQKRREKCLARIRQYTEPGQGLRIILGA
jgi:hypothetical protein